MFQITKTTLILTALLLVVVWFANTQSRDVPYTEHINGQAVPTPVSFRITLGVLDGYISKGHRNHAVGWLQQELNMDETTAATFLDQLVATKQALETESQEAVARHACSEGEAHDLLYQMYDIEEEIAARHYAKIKATLDADTSVLLDSWMIDMKSGMGQSRTDFEKSHRLNGTDYTGTIAGLCR